MPPSSAPKLSRLADVIVYDAETVTELKGVSVAALRDLLVNSGPNQRVWADFETADRQLLVPELASIVQLNPISAGVLVERDHRPSVDEFGSIAHVIVELVHVRETLFFEKVDILTGPRWLITIQDHPGDCFGVVRGRLHSQPAFRGLSTPYLLHALCESACRDYHRVLRRFGERLETLESRLVSRPVPALMQRIHAAKRDLRGLRRAVVPLRESIETLFFSNRKWTGGDTPSNPDLVLALREIHDELGGVLDVLDAYRDATHNLTDLYMNGMSNRVNDVLRVLTIISTIFIPLSFVAGVYGMNFEHMPELRWRYGYPLALGLMALIAGLLLLYFFRKGWLRRSDVPRLPSITRTTGFFEDGVAGGPRRPEREPPRPPTP